MNDANRTPEPPARNGIDRWQGLNFQPIRRTDLLLAALVCLFGMLSMLSGLLSTRHVAPGVVQQIAGMLDDLETPSRLPDSPLLAEDGSAAPLLSHLQQDETVVSFYAPWCSPCQKELPELVDSFAPEGRLLVVITGSEDPGETRRQLDNLGQDRLPFYIDITGGLQREGRVKALPTLFLVARRGEVLEHMEGYNEMQLYRIKERIDPSYNE